MAATITITGTINYDVLADSSSGTGWTVTGNKTGNDTVVLDGGTLVIDTDTRYCANHTTTTGNVATLGTGSVTGGKLLLDGTKVFLIPYDAGTAAGQNVPAIGTAVAGGTSGAGGVLLGVWSAFNAAPTAAGVAIGKSADNNVTAPVLLLNDVTNVP